MADTRHSAETTTRTFRAERVTNDVAVETLLETPSVTVRNVVCRGSHRHKSEAEAAQTTQLVFPYRGAFVRHLGSDEAVGDLNQVMLFNDGEEYQISHPIPGGDACIQVLLHDDILDEVLPRSLRRPPQALAFSMQRLRVDPEAQVMVASLRHAVPGHTAQLDLESTAVAVARRVLARDGAEGRTASINDRRLVDRIKKTIASDLGRRWSLADIAAEVRRSAVYLTQVFQRVEGIPLYRYQLQLRLARALDLVTDCDDLSSLSQDLGFSSHSHFTEAFRRAYRLTPSTYRASRASRIRPKARATP